MRTEQKNYLLDISMAVNELAQEHDLKNNKNLMIGVTTHFRAVKVSVYDITNMLEDPKDIEDVLDIIEENCLDSSDFIIAEKTL